MRSKIVKRKSKSTPIVQLACYKKRRISPTGQTGLALQRLPIGDAEGAIACSVAKRRAFSRRRVPRYLHHRQQKIKNKPKNNLRLVVYGGDNGTRTRGLCVANASLYQLSHIPTAEIILPPCDGIVKRYCTVKAKF